MNAKAESMNVYGVILAGGVGERLWPLSRQDHPKQFLAVGSSDTLLQQSINRFTGVVSPRSTWVITSACHASYILENMKDSVDNLLVEPCGRNTAPALLYACLELYKQDPDATVVFAPADPYIPEADYPLYRTSISQAISFAQSNDAIVLCGVKPTYPATGYGYETVMSDFFTALQQPEYVPLVDLERLHMVAQITLLIDQLACEGGGKKEM